MPQNPLEVLKGLAMRNVPQPTQQQQENRDLRATAIQDEQSPFSLKSIGRNALDAVTQGLAGDPFKEGAEKSSMGGKLGMLGAAAPMMPKKLPIISPEAYNDVKAGGLRLYSRLTDAFAKAPNVMKPAKALSIAQSGASKEEIGLRKLHEFLSGRPEMADIPREEIMTHLSQNPLELEVARKGQAAQNPAHQKFNEFIHRMDTEHGQGWVPDDLGSDFPHDLGTLTPEQTLEYRELERLSDEALHTPHGGTEYSFLQTPGPSENYGESLIKVPQKLGTEEEARKLFLDVNGYPIEKSNRFDANPTPEQLAEHIQEYRERVAEDKNFKSGHFQSDPNTLVWSRHNDRYAGHPQGYDGTQGSFDKLDIASKAAGQGPFQPSGKGRFIEEIQSDWHQQGRERGYKGDPIDPKDINPVSTLDINDIRPPDAPFKDTYHELALKQQLLDAANDPSLEWLGVADAETNAAMEGHPSVREGTDLYYNQKHPSALEKLLKPLGGEVKHDYLPTYTTGHKQGPNVHDAHYDAIDPDHDHYNPTWEVLADDVPVATSNPYGIPGTTVPNDEALVDIIRSEREKGRNFPTKGMWKANLTPELKELIKTRGFPAMAAILGLKTAIEPNRPE